MMQRLLRVIVLTSMALMPATVFAQASIVGTVRDASGAVLPGVTVEASSPALIEKTRSPNRVTHRLPMAFSIRQRDAVN